MISLIRLVERCRHDELPADASTARSPRPLTGHGEHAVLSARLTLSDEAGAQDDIGEGHRISFILPQDGHHDGQPLHHLQMLLARYSSRPAPHFHADVYANIYI